MNEYSGPPFSAVNSSPSSRNVTVIAVPGVPGPASPYRETFRIFDSPRPPPLAENTET